MWSLQRWCQHPSDKALLRNTTHDIHQSSQSITEVQLYSCTDSLMCLNQCRTSSLVVCKRLSRLECYVALRPLLADTFIKARADARNTIDIQKQLPYRLQLWRCVIRVSGSREGFLGFWILYIVLRSAWGPYVGFADPPTRIIFERCDMFKSDYTCVCVQETASRKFRWPGSCTSTRQGANSYFRGANEPEKDHFYPKFTRGTASRRLFP